VLFFEGLDARRRQPVAAFLFPQRPGFGLLVRSPAKEGDTKK
jgi:hypothetical protein